MDDVTKEAVTHMLHDARFDGLEVTGTSEPLEVGDRVVWTVFVGQYDCLSFSLPVDWVFGFQERKADEVQER